MTLGGEPEGPKIKIIENNPTHSRKEVFKYPTYMPPSTPRGRLSQADPLKQRPVAGASPSSLSSLTVKLHVEAIPIWGAPGCLEGTALGIAPKQKAVLARKFFGFQDPAIFQKDAGTRCDIAAGFDDAIITQ
jgi:hypothetical protein